MTDTIDDVEKILNGEVEIPNRVTILEKWDKRLKVAWTVLAGVFGLDKVL